MQNVEYGFALGGGGTRAYSQIGAMAYLEEKGIKPTFISGTSMGAIHALLLGMGFNAQGICDFYFVFLSALNLEGPEKELNGILEETKLFYLYFQEQELSNLNILLTVYNGAILKHYSIYDDAAIMKIPCLNLVSFLDEMEAMVSSNWFVYKNMI